MTTYYVDGTSGNDAYSGLAATFTGGSTGPKATLSAVESLLAAGDTVYVRAGTYRETLTCGVSGTSGNPIEYRGDYTGAIWAGGGVVRITGSDNDQTATRASAVSFNTRNYRTFRRFVFDTTTSSLVTGTTGGFLTIEDCYFGPHNFNDGIGITTGTNLTVRRCVFSAGDVFNAAVHINTTNNSLSHTIENCLFLLHSTLRTPIMIWGGGTVLIRNCTFLGGNRGVWQRGTNASSVTVNNCIFYGVNIALDGTSVGDIVEDYNTIYQCSTSRSNTSTGAHSVAYPPLFDVRWVFQLMYAAAVNQVVTPFDLASYSQLINLAGTSPTTTDMRGTSAIGGVRELGALEYDSALKIQGGSGGAVSISPLRGRLGG